MFVVHVYIEFPDLGVVKIGEVQKGHEPVRISVISPCDDGERRAVVAGRFYGPLENGRGHIEAGVWLDVKLRLAHTRVGRAYLSDAL